MNYPPHSTEAEAGLIGAAVLAPNIIPRLLTDHHITPGDFYTPFIRKMWEGLVHLHDEGQHIDNVTLAAHLKYPEAQFEVDDMVAHASDVGAIRQHARVMKEMTRRRSWLRASYELSEAALTGDEGKVATAEKMLAAPTVSDDTAETEDLGMQVASYLAGTGSPGIPTPFPELDDRLGGGLRRGATTAIGAWTSNGKSVLVNQILAHARLQGLTAHLYINEMSLTDVTLRHIARMTGIPVSRLMKRTLTDDEHRRAVDAAGRLPFGITDAAQWSADQIARHIRANRWDICAVDILHNMPYDKQSELHQMTSRLVAAALSADTHLILVCHLNEARATGDVLPVPVIRDIRDSGMIKNLCHNVLLLHRHQKKDGGIPFMTNDAVLVAGKARGGQLGAVLLEFEPERMRFSPARALRVAS